MKILLLNPQIDAEHEISRNLEAAKIAVLYPSNLTEALQMLQLHGTSVDLAIIHREGIETVDSNVGIQFISKVKADPQHADLPIILTTQAWSQTECAQHQQGPEGVNAYLHSPFTFEQLQQTIEAVLGVSLTSPAQSLSEPSLPQPSSQKDSGDFVLEDASQVFMRPEEPTKSGATSIVLEAPSIQPSIQNEPSITEPSPSEPLISAPPPSPPPLSIEPAIEPTLPTATGIEITLPTAILPTTVTQMSEAPPSEFQGEDLSPDLETEQEMPYLFRNDSNHLLKTPARPKDPSLLLAEPTGDAVIPGGAAQSPDMETIKKYLMLREQDVAVLSNQLKAARDQIQLQEQTLREEKARNAELTHIVNEYKEKIDHFEKEKNLALSNLQSEMDELHFQVKSKNDHARALENQMQAATEEIIHLKDRVRTDIRKIRVREKELENRLELLKKDSEALINARENKIIELKRKLDLLEFNMDLLQDQYSREREYSAQLRERLAKAAQIVRVAGGLLDSPQTTEIDETSSRIKKEREAS